MKIKIVALLLIIIELGNAGGAPDIDGASVGSSIDIGVEEVPMRANEGTNAGVQVHHRESNIFRAIQEDDLEAVEYFIKNGADVNQADDDGMTPLFIASANGYIEVVKYLIRNGANLNMAMNEGITPIYVASQEN
jgi:ankyrin repeat protein